MLLVGHSGGGMPVAQAADRIPDRIARVVYVESGPLPDGTAQFDTVPPEEQQRLRAAIGDGHLLPPPAWDPAADPANLAGLDEPTLALLRTRATPQPLRAATDPVRRTGGRPVPTALVASTFPLAVVRADDQRGPPVLHRPGRRPAASRCPPGTGRCSASRRLWPTSSTLIARS